MMFTGMRIFVDANVLMSRTIRDWLCLLRVESKGGMFTLVTSEDVLAEVEYHLRRKIPDADGEVIVSLRGKIVSSFDEVLTGFPGNLSNPTSDPNDQHVHCGAISSGAEILLTLDSGFLDLEEQVLDVLPYEVMTPDSLFLLIDDSASRIVRRTTVRQLAYWHEKRLSSSLASKLRSSKCDLFANRVEEHLKNLSGVSANRKSN